MSGSNARVAVLDDWQGVAAASADWSRLAAAAEIVSFAKPFASLDEAAAALLDFDVIMAMRERTAFPAALLQKLPKLRFISMTGRLPASLDLAACTGLGILVATTGGASSAQTAELAVGLLLAVMREIPKGDAAMRAGGFQAGTLGIVGLGKIGSRVARAGRALGMEVIAWSQNLTQAAAEAEGATLVEKAELLERADAISLHLVLSDRTRGILGAADLARMKPGAVVINTSRGPLIDEAALVAALEGGRLRAGLDVYDQEPLPSDHPLRRAPGTVLTPHLGYCTQEGFSIFFTQGIENVMAFLEDRTPQLAVNPEVWRPR
jgi:phosphoglycerate dehydrogenase-like enzyme